MPGAGSQIISSGMQHVRESLVRVQGLVIKINPLHLQQLRADEAAHKAQIRKMISDPRYIEDEFARRRMAPREIHVYGEIDYLPPRAPTLAQKYLQPGARIGFVTPMPATQIQEMMSLPTLSVMIRERELDTGHAECLKIEIEDPRMPCAVGGTQLFGENARSVTYMKSFDSAPAPCETCRCPRKPQP